MHSLWQAMHGSRSTEPPPKEMETTKGVFLMSGWPHCQYFQTLKQYLDGFQVGFVGLCGCSHLFTRSSWVCTRLKVTVSRRFRWRFYDLWGGGSAEQDPHDQVISHIDYGCLHFHHIFDTSTCFHAYMCTSAHAWMNMWIYIYAYLYILMH